MKALVVSVIFTVLSLSSAFAGEWHSAGNAPPIPYFPQTPAEYECSIEVITNFNYQAYREVFTHVFHNDEFQDRQQRGVGFFEVKDAADPGMNGQKISVRFDGDGRGKEWIKLVVMASIRLPDGSLASNLRSQVRPRSEGFVEEKAELMWSSPDFSANRSVEISVRCESQNR